MFYPPDTIAYPADALETTARDHDTALAPISPTELDEVLAALSSSTIRQVGPEKEILASFAILRAHLSKLPSDILRQACSIYIRTPGKEGKVFFPRSPAEILRHATPLLFKRQQRAHRLRQLAALQRERDAERERLANDPLCPDQVDETNLLFKRVGIKTRYRPDGSTFIPSPGDPDPCDALEKCCDSGMTGDLEAPHPL